MIMKIFESIVVEGIVKGLKEIWKKIKGCFAKNEKTDTKPATTEKYGEVELDSVGKYITYSRKRNKFNNISLNEVKIKYTFKDNEEDKNTLSVDVEYLFSGNVKGNPMRYLLTYLSMREYNKENISMEAFDVCTGHDVVPRIKKEDNDGLEYGDNGAYWRIPFYGDERRYMDTIETKLKLSWKRFSPKNEIDPLIIDPRNYAENANVRKIEITVVNDTQNHIINTIEMCEYNRLTSELFNDNSEYSIYEAVDNKEKNKELLNKTIKRNEINKDKIFVLYCK